jgi:hypothetical protein
MVKTPARKLAVLIIDLYFTNDASSKTKYNATICKTIKILPNKNVIPAFLNILLRVLHYDEAFNSNKIIYAKLIEISLSMLVTTTFLSALKDTPVIHGLGSFEYFTTSKPLVPNKSIHSSIDRSSKPHSAPELPKSDFLFLTDIYIY